MSFIMIGAINCDAAVSELLKAPYWFYALWGILGVAGL